MNQPNKTELKQLSTALKMCYTETPSPFKIGAITKIVAYETHIGWVIYTFFCKHGESAGIGGASLKELAKELQKRLKKEKKEKSKKNLLKKIRVALKYAES